VKLRGVNIHSLELRTEKKRRGGKGRGRSEDSWPKYQALPKRQRRVWICAGFHSDVSGGIEGEDLGKLACVGNAICKGEEFRSTSWIAVNPDLEGSLGNGRIERLN